MSSRTFAEPKKKSSTAFSPILGKKSGQTLNPKSADGGHDMINPGFGHNFGNIRVTSGESFKQSCPLALSSPTYCPFGGACHTCPARIQTKLMVGESGDKYEQEADRVAEQMMQMSESQPVRKVGVSGWDQPSRFNLQRNGTDQAALSAVSPIVHDVLHSSGQPLDSATRNFVESRFGDDFSQVRVHTGSKAAESARTMNAQAYTVGRDVVFGGGQYATATIEGKRLLAHELTHVLQQQNSPGLQGSVLQCKGPTLYGFLRGLGRAIAGFFTGREPHYDEQTLQRYLKTLDDTGDIEDDFDSDNKARGIVNAWKEGGSPYALTSRRKALLIREMQSDFTGDDDERAILEILGRSYNFELTYIFGAGGVSAKKLNSDFHTKEWHCLQNFYQRRFEGGMEAVLKGKVKPIGQPVALGESLPECSIPGALPGFPAFWSIECLLGILCSQDKTIVAQLPNLTVQKANQVTEFYWEYDGTRWVHKNRTRGAFSSVSQRIIGLKTTQSCADAAQSVVHEVRHQNQPTTWTVLERERDAYTFTEEWTIKRGLPGRPRFRQRIKGTKEETVSPDEIEKYVKRRYSGITTTPGDEIIDHNAAGETVVQRPDGTTYTRPPQAGDTHQDVARTRANLAGLPEVDPTKWVCPETK